jgi:hypothetical protein
MQDILDLEGKFTWCWGMHFFVETAQGNFVWSDPDYGGVNTLTKFNGTYKDYCHQRMIPFGRHKGNHIIRDYCGSDVKVLG